MCAAVASVARPRLHEAGEQSGELFGLVGREAGERGLDRAAPVAACGAEQPTACVGEHDRAAACVGGIDLTADVPRLDRGLHEPARPRLVDADRLGEFAHRRRPLGALERLEQSEPRQVRQVRAPMRTLVVRMLRALAMCTATVPPGPPGHARGAGVAGHTVPAVPSVVPALLAAGAVVPVTTTPNGPIAATSTSAATAAAAPSPRTALARGALTSLGAALQAPPLLIAPHGDERLLDDRDRVARILRRVAGP